MISETSGPNISVYPDTNEIGIFDAGRRSERRFGARFDVADAVSDYGGGKAKLTPPSPGPRQAARPLSSSASETRSGRRAAPR